MSLHETRNIYSTRRLSINCLRTASPQLVSSYGISRVFYYVITLQGTWPFFFDIYRRLSRLREPTRGQRKAVRSWVISLSGRRRFC